MPEFWSALGNTIWWALSFLILISSLMVLFSVIGDIFRDRELSGGAKALWLFCLIFFTFLSLLVYLIVRGKGMNDRSVAQAAQTREAAADEIGRAKALLDAGTVTADEYASRRALA